MRARWQWKRVVPAIVVDEGWLRAVRAHGQGEGGRERKTERGGRKGLKNIDIFLLGLK